ncbi:MAG: hypothetical protein P1U56_09610 [Saprospiraceae bacterium]|nr:hypothetical protein [Saprospiraceae bacterium]
MKNILSALLLSVFFLMSCGDDAVDCNNTNFVTEVNASIEAYNAAVTAYTNDPTSDNCEAIKTAAQDYLDAVQQFEDCTDITDYQAQVTAAQDAINSINC